MCLWFVATLGISMWLQSHRRMKADAEWESLTAKVEGREELYKGVEVID